MRYNPAGWKATFFTIALYSETSHVTNQGGDKLIHIAMEIIIAYT